MSGEKDAASTNSPARLTRSSSAPKGAPSRPEGHKHSRSRSRSANGLKEKIQAEYNKQLQMQVDALKANKREEPSGRSNRRDSPSPRYRTSSRGSKRDRAPLDRSTRDRRPPRDSRQFSRSRSPRRSSDKRMRDRRSRDRRSRDRRSRGRRPSSRGQSRQRWSRSPVRRRERTPPRRTSRDWRDKRRERERRRVGSPPRGRRRSPVRSRSRRSVRSRSRPERSVRSRSRPDRNVRSRSRTERSVRSRSRSRNKQPPPVEEPRVSQVQRLPVQQSVAVAQINAPTVDNLEIIRRAKNKWRNKPKAIPTSFKHPALHDPFEERRRERDYKRPAHPASPVISPAPVSNPLAGLPSKHPLITKGHLDQEKGVVWMPTPILEPVRTREPFLNAKPTGYAGKPRPMMTCSAHGRRRSVWDLRLNESGFWECLPGSKCVDDHGLTMPTQADQGNVLKRYKEKLLLEQKMACAVAEAQEQAERMLKLNSEAGKGPVPPLPHMPMGFPK